MYKLSPSKAHRFLNCTKSLEFEEPWVDTPWSIRGNILHDFAKMRLLDEDTQEIEKESEFNSYEYYLINEYVKAVWNEYNYIIASDLFVERKEPIVLYDFNINLIIDALIISEDIASIIDLKTGNVEVDPVGNEQLIFYAYSVLYKFPQIKTFRLSIFQKGKLKTHIMTREEIYDFFIERENIFEEIRSEKLTYNPSEKACRYCAIKDTCVARAKWIIGGKK